MLSLVATLGPIILGLLTKFIPDAAQAAEIHQQIMTAIAAFETSLVSSMGNVMAADAKSEGWLTRNARPIVVMWTLIMITVLTFSPLFGGVFQHGLMESLKAIPSDLWDIVKVGIGGYMLARTADKWITTQTAGAK